VLRKLSSKRIARFLAVGLCNAAISFGILNLAFFSFGQSKIVSSIIATTCALIFSFVLNRNFVFDDKTRSVTNQAPAFILVTITGSLLVLNLVYVGGLKILNGHESMLIGPLQDITSIRLSKSFIDINISTVVGAIVAMFWNYNGYKWFVFKGSKKHVTEEVDLTI
jgi:putative flippase GtrA